MKKPGLVAFGAFLFLIGALWFGQGVGWIGGSGMSGETLWAVVGPIVALGGLGMVVFGVRGSGSSGSGGRPKNTKV